MLMDAWHAGSLPRVGAAQAAVGIAFLVITWKALAGIYNVYFHPLAKFPGPKWAAFSLWWKVNLELLQGQNLHEKLEQLHSIYGDVVRIGPNELHFGDASAYHEIYNSKNRWSRDPLLYHVFSTAESTLTMMEYSRAKKRKDLLQPLFSRKAIIQLQHLIQDCAIKMCANIEEQHEQGKSINVFKAYRCLSVDTITSYCYGQSVNATTAPDFNGPLPDAMLASMPPVPALRLFPLLKMVVETLPAGLVSFMQPSLKGLMDMRETLKRQVRELLDHPEVLDSAPHPTIFHKLIDTEDPSKTPPFMSLRDEALLMIFAGTDTSSNALTLGTVHILANPDIHMRLKSELLAAWPELLDRPRYEELDSLPYLKAVIKETLRLSHGVLSPMTRIVPASGTIICGQAIPPGTIVGISNCFVHLNAKIFKDPHVFDPSRWLEDTTGNLDDWLVAFSKGPRSCLGQNLGWCEIVLGYANMFRRFDLQLDGVSPSDLHWKECYTPHYEGPDLMVTAKPRTS